VTQMAKPATWHKHPDLACVDCGVIVYPGPVTCVMNAGAAACTLPLGLRCAVCSAVDQPPAEPSH
jgi:hypothetical protein